VIVHAKALIQLIAAVLAAVAPLVLDTGMGPSEWINVAIIAAGVVLVWNSTNLPGYRYAKAVASGVVAALTLVPSLLTGGLSASEVIQIVIAFLIGVGGVISVRNRLATDGVFREGPYAVSGGGGYGGALR
jgi:hypothetical protein